MCAVWLYRAVVCVQYLHDDTRDEDHCPPILNPQFRHLHLIAAARGATGHYMQSVGADEGHEHGVVEPGARLSKSA
jgi:hypothetical protein